MRSRTSPIVRAAALLALAAAAPAQYSEPPYELPWIGYDINVYPSAIEIWDCTTGDLDRDGITDLAAVSWYPNPELSVLFGDGNGGYRQPVTYPLALASLGVEAADFDADGDLDLALSDSGQFWEGFTFSLFVNDGSGAFTLQAHVPCGNGPSGITTGDFDGDGRLDVAVAHDAYIVAGRSIAIVLGVPGGFAPPQVLPMPSGTYDIEAADWDLDGDSDLVVGHEGRRVSLLRNEDGNFGTPIALIPDPVGALFRSPDVLVADPDGDGDPDVLFSGEGSVNTGIGFVNLFRNENGAFGAPERFALAPEMDGAAGLHVSDVDGDGALDLLAAGGFETWALLRGDGTGGFLPARGFRCGQAPFRIVTPDADRDADRDVVVVARGSMEACVYLNPGAAAFAQPAASPMIDPEKAPVSSSEMGVADLDHDGRLDFVVGYSANFIPEVGLHVRRGLAGGALGPIQRYATPLFPETLAVGDVSGDGFADVVWLETDFGIGTPRLRLKLNDGTGAFGATRTLPGNVCGGSDADIALLDVDRDLDIDIVVANCLQTVFIYQNTGAGEFGTPRRHTVSDVASAVAGGDFDSDGDIDLATNTGIQGFLEISLGNGNGTFQPPFTEAAGRDVQAIAVADVDGDAVLDLLSGFALDGDGASVVRGRGDGTFRPPVNYHGSYSGSTDDILVADVDRDGALDLLCANRNSQDVSFWRNRGDGTFELLRRWGVGYPVLALALADRDGDGVDDLVAQVEPNAPLNGWYYPALVVLKGKDRGFRNLGFALAGSRGLPVLDGVGLLVPGQPFRLAVSNAAAAAPAAYFLGGTRVDLPLLGGVLVPLPQIVVPGATDPSGRASLQLPWPAGLPLGAAVYAQTWILDTGAPQGAAATNALSATQR